MAWVGKGTSRETARGSSTVNKKAALIEAAFDELHENGANERALSFNLV
jgi:hypothetical protein